MPVSTLSQENMQSPSHGWVPIPLGRVKLFQFSFMNTPIRNEEDSALKNPQWLAFCKQHNIVPFEWSDEYIDWDSGLLQDLKEAFLNGSYNYNNHITLAKGSKEVQNQVCDGKHRCIGAFLAWMENKSIRFPSIIYEPVADIYALKCRIAHYVMQSRSKNAQLARKIVQANLQEVVDAKLDKFGDRLPAEIVRMGFKNVKIINKLVNDAMGRKKGRPAGASNKPLHPSSRSVTESQSWGLPENKNQESGSDSVHATEADDFNRITTYTEKCPTCKAPLIIVTSTHGQVLEVKHAPTIAK